MKNFAMMLKPLALTHCAAVHFGRRFKRGEG